MAIPTHTITCLSNERIARDIYEFRFKKPDGFTFKPGQFVLFDVALIDNPDDVQTRAMSIASAPSEDELLFVAKMKDGGRISRWIEEVLKPGTTATIKGPFGNFTLDKETNNEYLFVATSTGIAPFRSQIIDAQQRGDMRRMDIVFGVRSEEDVFWKGEFEKITQDMPNLYVHFALSGASDSWTGHRGRVQTLVPKIVDTFVTKSIYVCGSPEMTKDFKQLCMEEWNVERKNLHIEGYI